MSNFNLRKRLAPAIDMIVALYAISTCIYLVVGTFYIIYAIDPPHHMVKYIVLGDLFIFTTFLPALFMSWLHVCRRSKSFRTYSYLILALLLLLAAYIAIHPGAIHVTYGAPR